MTSQQNTSVFTALFCADSDSESTDAPIVQIEASTPSKQTKTKTKSKPQRMSLDEFNRLAAKKEAERQATTRRERKPVKGKKGKQRVVKRVVRKVGDKAKAAAAPKLQPTFEMEAGAFPNSLETTSTGAVDKGSWGAGLSAEVLDADFIDPAVIKRQEDMKLREERKRRDRALAELEEFNEDPDEIYDAATYAEQDIDPELDTVLTKQGVILRQPEGESEKRKQAEWEEYQAFLQYEQEQLQDQDPAPVPDNWEDEADGPEDSWWEEC